MASINTTVIHEIEELSPKFYEDNCPKSKKKHRKLLPDKEPFTFNGIPTY